MRVWYDRIFVGGVVMRPSQRSTHFTFPDPDGLVAAGTVEIEAMGADTKAMGADTTVELGGSVPKHASWLLFPVTVMSGLVLASIFPDVFWFEAAGWTRKIICVPSRIWTSQSCCVVLFEVGRSRVKDWPPGIKPRISGGRLYRVEFHATVWVVHGDGTGGSSVKKEFIDETSAVTQLASAESPTVWIKDTPPVPRPVGRGEREGCVNGVKVSGVKTNTP